MLILPGGLEAPDLPNGPFDVLSADPPWKFRGYSAARGNRDVSRHYPLMTIKQIRALPVADIMAKDSILFMWVTSPMLADGIDLMSHWGFKFSTVGFAWIKTLRRYGNGQDAWVSIADIERELHMGGGYTTRKNLELCLIGRRGKGIPRKSKSVREVIVAPVREHSRKPDEYLPRVEKYVGTYMRKIEMFSRTNRKHWAAWGDQTGKFD